MPLIFQIFPHEHANDSASGIVDSLLLSTRRGWEGGKEGGNEGGREERREGKREGNCIFRNKCTPYLLRGDPQSERAKRSQ